MKTNRKKLAVSRFAQGNRAHCSDLLNHVFVLWMDSHVRVVITDIIRTWPKTNPRSKKNFGPFEAWARKRVRLGHIKTHGKKTSRKSNGLAFTCDILKYHVHVT